MVPGLGVLVQTAPRRKPKAPPPTAPNRTLYVRNLNENMPLSTIQMALNALFSEFGVILQIRAKKNIPLRGQAFVTFEDQNSATTALNEAQGFPLFSLPMDIQYARDQNFIFSYEDGTLDSHQEKLKAPEKKRRTKEFIPSLNNPSGWDSGWGTMPAELLPPNTILFVENLPAETTSKILSQLFQQIPGFKEVRLVPGKSDIAFVEYETEAQSTLAKQQLNNFKILEDREMKVTYARK